MAGAQSIGEPFSRSRPALSVLFFERRLPLWVKTRRTGASPGRSAPGGKADRRPTTLSWSGKIRYPGPFPMAAVSAEPFFRVFRRPPSHVPVLPGSAHSTVAFAFGAPAFDGLHQHTRDDNSDNNVPSGSNFHAPSRRLLAATSSSWLSAR